MKTHRDPLVPGVAGRARDRLADDLRRWRARFGIPGAALVFANARGATDVLLDGESDLARHVALDEAHRFQIGSISKAATATAVLRAVDRGLLQLHDPVRRYLPWFEAGTSSDRITIHHLLSHMGGLPFGGDADDASPFDVWALREAEVLPPGERYWYSNVGYKAIGCLLATVHDRPLPDVLQSDVLGPIGMAGSRGAVRLADLDGAVTGHERRPGDYPLSRAPVVPSPLIEVSMGDGSVAATPRDMGAFAAALLRAGASERGGASFLRPDSARALFGRHARTGPGKWYGYGIGVDRLDERPVFGHAGDMLGFRCSLIGDAEAGLAVVILTNLRDAPTRVMARHALRTLWADRAGGPPPPLTLDETPELTALAGRYGGPSGTAVFAADDGVPWLELDGTWIRLLHRGGTAFELDDPLRGRHLVRVESPNRRGETRLTIGPEVFVRDGSPGSAGRSPRTGILGPYPGIYRSRNPWRRSIEVIVRDRRLVLIDDDGEETPLVRLGPGRFRIGRGNNPERLVFDADAGGRPLRATASGQPFFRVE